MHRTEADGSGTVGSLPDQHLDQNLPGTPGTTVSAEFLNALGEEIINVVERAGLTIEASAAADRTAGFVQLETALFDSAALDTAALADGAVTDAKVTSVALDKFILGTGTGEAEITEDVGGDPDIVQKIRFSPYEVYIELEDSSGSPVDKKYAELDEDSLTLEHQEDAALQERSILTPSQLAIRDRATANINKDSTFSTETLTLNRTNTSTNTVEQATASRQFGFIHEESVSAVTTHKAQLDYNGLQFLNSGRVIRFECIEVTTTGWSGTGPWTKGSIATNIPNGSELLAGSFSRVGGGLHYANICPAENGIQLQDGGGSTMVASLIAESDPTSATRLTLTLWYEE